MEGQRDVIDFLGRSSGRRAGWAVPWFSFYFFLPSAHRQSVVGLEPPHNK